MAQGKQITNEKLNVLRNVSLAEIAYEKIHEYIFSGAIEPGAHINENQVAEDLGINRAPVREACRQLQKEGLIEIAKNKGAFIRNISPQEAIELYEIRASLEVLAVEKAAEFASSEDLSRLERCVDELVKASASKDESLHYEQAIRFHQIISESTGNQNLIEMNRMVCNKIALFRRKLSDYMENALACDDEVEILQALKNRDADRASQLMKNHVLNGRNRVQKNFFPEH